MKQHRKQKTGFFSKLHNKYRLVLRDDATLEEKLSLRLTRLNVFLFFGVLAILLVVGTTYIIAFTPLREYIPGYADFNTRRILRDLVLKADSLERDLRQKDLYIHNIRNIVEGREPEDMLPEPPADQESFLLESLPRSAEDSILRAEMESMGASAWWNGAGPTPQTVIQSYFFFPPLQGLVTNHFDPASGHYGIDVVADENTAIKAILDGSVLFSSWTIETGYTLAIQHAGNLVSIYKHNSALLKQEGHFVRAGDAIAIIGNTGLFSSGTHLHFELWYNGNPVNPLDFIVF